MKLRRYRELQGLTIEQAASANAVTDTAWRLWEAAQRCPGEDNMMGLFLWSRGAVQPNDFYPIEEWVKLLPAMAEK